MKDYNMEMNLARLANAGKVLTEKEMREVLKELPYHNHGSFIKALIVYDCIEKLSKDQFKFTDKPVYKEKLKSALEYLQEKQRKYNTALQSKKAKIQKAIELLLSTGQYEIYRIEEVVTINKIKL